MGLGNIDLSWGSPGDNIPPCTGCFKAFCPNKIENVASSKRMTFVIRWISRPGLHAAIIRSLDIQCEGSCIDEEPNCANGHANAICACTIHAPPHAYFLSGSVYACRKAPDEILWMCSYVHTHEYAPTRTQAHHKQAMMINEIKEETTTCKRLGIMTSAFISKTPITQLAHSLSSLRSKQSYLLQTCLYRTLTLEKGEQLPWLYHVLFLQVLGKRPIIGSARLTTHITMAGGSSGASRN